MRRRQHPEIQCCFNAVFASPCVTAFLRILYFHFRSLFSRVLPLSVQFTFSACCLSLTHGSEVWCMARCIIITNSLSKKVAFLVIARVLVHVGKGLVQRSVGTEVDLPDLFSLFCTDCKRKRIIANIWHARFSCGDNNFNVHFSGVKMKTKIFDMKWLTILS